MHPDIVIQEIDITDVLSWRAFYRDLIEAELYSRDEEDHSLLLPFYQYGMAQDRQKFLCHRIAWAGNQIVGIAVIAEIWVSNHQPYDLIVNTYVKPLYRLQGIGRALVAPLPTRFPGLKGILTLEAHRLYRSLGIGYSTPRLNQLSRKLSTLN